MTVKASFRYMTLLVTVWQANEVTSTKVDQFPKDLTVHRGGNASMFCTFSIQQVTPDVYWWRWGEKTFIEPDSRKIIYTKKGSADFVLLNANVADSGVYYCKVKHQQQSIGDGPGSRLTVIAPPTPLSISQVNGSSPPKLVCQTAAFFPKEVKISWQRNGVTIFTGEEPVNTSSVEGLYVASSFLEVTKPTWRVDIYTCLVSHVSLTVAARVDYTVKPDSNLALIIGCVVGGLAILVPIIILTVRRLNATNDINRSSMESRRVAETTKGSEADKPTYTALQFSKSIKSAPKPKKEHPVYAVINISKGKRDYE